MKNPIDEWALQAATDLEKFPYMDRLIALSTLLSDALIDSSSELYDVHGREDIGPQLATHIIGEGSKFLMRFIR